MKMTKDTTPENVPDIMPASTMHTPKLPMNVEHGHNQDSGKSMSECMGKCGDGKGSWTKH